MKGDWGGGDVCETQRHDVEITAWTGLSWALSPAEMSHCMCFPRGRQTSAFRLEISF